MASPRTSNLTPTIGCQTYLSNWTPSLLATLTAYEKKRLYESARELWIRDCRRDLLTWCIESLSSRGLKPAKHHRLLVSYLQRVADGEIKRLMIFMPPGSGKSTFVTTLFAPWIFERFPGCQIIGASHTAELAEDFSRKIQDQIREHSGVLTYVLATENRGRWYTTDGGSYLAAGVGGAIPGFRADVGIIDDPIKGRQAADSEADRKRVWDWYLGDFERRLTPDAPVVVMHTRWHEDDLAGRLLETQSDKWTVLTLPAQAEADDVLGRAPGEWLWTDDDYGYGASLAEIKATLDAAGAAREWASQYQQHPRPAEGLIFKVGNISILPTAPVGNHIARGWDLAATDGGNGRDPDRTSGIKLMRADDGRYVILDDRTFAGGPEEVERAIVNTAEQDGRGVRIGLPQDPGQAGKSQVRYYAKRLAGYVLDSVPVTGDKATRAAPIASQVNVGNVAMVKAPWNAALLDELAAFPAGAHDDRVDALAEAFRIVGLQPGPYRISGSAMTRLGR
jgi:predicted phage terminase large subunit-like protein